jgi:hypothetical protein
MTDSVPEIETVNAHMLVKFSVVVLGSLTRMLLGCADHLELHVYFPFYFALVRYSPPWLWLLSMFPISHVLYYFSLVFFDVSVMACLYVTLYYTNVSSCSLEDFFHPPPQMVLGTQPMIGLSRLLASRFTPVPSTSYHVKNTCRRHPPCASVLAGKS